MKPLGIVLIFVIVIAVAETVYRIVARSVVRQTLRRAIGTMFCRTFGHRRRRDTVRKVGGTYLSRCLVCDVRMTRQGRKGRWQVHGPISIAAAGETPTTSPDQE